jgi:hypothetical protein
MYRLAQNTLVADMHMYICVRCIYVCMYVSHGISVSFDAKTLAVDMYACMYASFIPSHTACTYTSLHTYTSHHPTVALRKRVIDLLLALQVGKTLAQVCCEQGFCGTCVCVYRLYVCLIYVCVCVCVCV